MKVKYESQLYKGLESYELEYKGRQWVCTMDNLPSKDMYSSNIKKVAIMSHGMNHYASCIAPNVRNVDQLILKKILIQ